MLGAAKEKQALVWAAWIKLVQKSLDHRCPGDILQAQLLTLGCVDYTGLRPIQTHQVTKTLVSSENSLSVSEKLNFHEKVFFSDS